MQVFANKENIGTLTKTGNTTVQLSSSVITLGAKQISVNSLTCDLSTNGAGGLDTGSIQPNKLYYIYIVLSGSSLSLVSSLSALGPSGFSTYKEMGKTFTSTSNVLTDVFAFGEEVFQEVRFYGTSNEGSVRTRIAYFSDGIRSERGGGCFYVTNDSANGLEITSLTECNANIVYSSNDNGQVVQCFITTGISGSDFTTTPVSLDSSKVIGAGFGTSGTSRSPNAVANVISSVNQKFYPHLSDVILTPTVRNILTIRFTAKYKDVI